MAGRAGDRWREALRRRQLASADRSGRFARNEVWKRQISFAKRAWKILVVFPLGLSVAFVPFIVLHPGKQAWVAIGVWAATAFWSEVLFVLMFSGVTRSLSALMAEGSTAADLRSMRRHGWSVVNGLVLRGRSDIDHVAVGPAGVLVLETKFSDHPWPVGTPGEPFMAGRLADACDQVRENAKWVGRYEDFRRAIGAAPVRPVVVVHSPGLHLDAGPGWVEEGDVTVVRGSHLRKWLDTLGGQELDADGVGLVWAELSKQADRRDRRDQERFGPPRPSMNQMLVKALIQLPLGLFAAIYAISLLGARGGGLRYLLVVASASAAGIGVFRRRVFRWFAAGWLAGIGAMAIVVMVVAVRLYVL